MLFEIKNATLTEVKDVVSGTSRTGNAWTKATAIVTKAEGSYTETIPMLVFGDKIQQAEDLVGKAVDVKFAIQSRDYNGRLYTDVKLQFVAPASDAQSPASAATSAHAPAPAPAPVNNDDPDGDLPF